MSTFLLVKANDEWIVFQNVQNNNLLLKTSDIQDYKVVHEYTEPTPSYDVSDIRIPLVPEDFPAPFSITTPWPAIGQEYYFVVMNNPFDISIQKSVITDEILRKYEETDSGNMFETYEAAAKVARNLTNMLGNASQEGAPLND